VRWCVVGLYLALITIVSLLPGRDFGGLNAPPGADKLAHIGMYAGFVLLSAWALWERGRADLRWLTLAAGVAFGYGMLMEIAQGAMDLGRTCSLADMLANAAGAGLGAALWRGWSRSARR